ncbi:ATP-binding SpoIIE family protein phosphatase [Streptomyces sp. NPDC047108]|uniref:ATP-binding SpoIIE family protein phosphatase n=1 Tax=Streptomyces sp. NPDC047108 TaxID=3155025 RepID=UPI0033E818C6
MSTSRYGGPDQATRKLTILPGSPLAPSTARKFVRSSLTDWAGLSRANTPLLGQVTDDAVLLVSELVTNAVVHAGTMVELRLHLEGAEEDLHSLKSPVALVVEVCDRDPNWTTADHQHAPGEHGRGLRIVGTVAEDWGVTYGREVKTVWFRLPVPAGDDLEIPPLPQPEVSTPHPELPTAVFVPRQYTGHEPVPPRTTVERWSFLAEASDLLAGQFDEDKLASLAALLLVPRLADWCAVWIDTPSGAGTTHPRLARVWHVNESRIGELRASLEMNTADLVRAGLQWPAPVPWPSLAPSPLGMGTGASGGAALACRLTDGEQQVGTLVLGRQGVAKMPDEVTGLVGDFARRFAKALVGAQDYTRQVVTSTVLQRGLLPTSLASVPGVDTHVVYEPAGEGAWAGGDFYDLFRAGDGRWCFVLGDVCGSGPEAAVVTGLVRPLLKALAQEGYGVARVLNRLNSMLVDEARAVEAAAAAVVAAGHLTPEADEPSRFLSLLFGELSLTGDGSRIRCTLASAGHPLPLLLKPDGQVLPAAEPQVLLGVVDNTTYQRQSFEFQRGDTLLCVTDGVTERRSGRHLFDDGDGLARVLSTCAGLRAAGVAERIRRAVHAFGAAPPSDDLAVLVLQAQ